MSTAKPKKPYPEFPLWAHSSGRWAKKINGKSYYFGKWDDPDRALQNYHDQIDAIRKGMPISRNEVVVTLQYACDSLLDTKLKEVNAGLKVPRTYQDTKVYLQSVCDFFGKKKPLNSFTPQDFKRYKEHLQRKYAITTLSLKVTKLQHLFNYAHKQGLIDKKPRYGVLERPTKAEVRKYKAKKAKKYFTPDQVVKLINSAKTVDFKAMILLGINCGFGNHDIATLQESMIDFDNGWIEFPRPKTGVDRKCKLWPETLEALKETMETRVASDRYPNHVFTTRTGNVWFKKSGNSHLAYKFKRFTTRLGLYEEGKGFYSLRHTFATIASNNCKDVLALKYMMGHTDNSMLSEYVEHIDDERLTTISNKVRSVIFPVPKLLKTSLTA